MHIDAQTERATVFRQLHGGPRLLILPNVWEVSGARVFEEAGFTALGTTSRGIAGSLGYADGEEMSREQMLRVVERIVSHVAIPVTADMEAGYGSTPEEVARTAEGVISAGAVGINIEDGRNIMGQADTNRVAALPLQIEMIQAVKAATTAARVPIVVNARTDVYWLEVGREQDRLSETIKRANAYRDAGADCLFIPGVKDRSLIATLVEEINGPINVLGTKGVPSIPELEQMGVARVSVGSGPMRATLALLKRIAEELQEAGTYASFTENALHYRELIESLAEEGQRHIDYPTGR